MTGLGSGVCAEAYAPMNGRPGSRVFLNSGLFPFLPYDQRVAAIAHELGHTVGFRHTNWQGAEPQTGHWPGNDAHYDAMHILGTPTGGDPNSIMNGGTCGNSPTTLSSFDILTMQFLYPANPPVAGTIPIFRYYHRYALLNHFYTPDYNEIGDGAENNYIFEGIGFWAFPNQVPNSVGIHRWYLPNGSDHFYTADPNEIAPGNYEGIWWYAYPSAINGALPVHRYYSPSLDNHFYTKNPNELAFMPGYNNEGIGWYAY